MGGVRRIRKQLNKTCMIKTGLSFEGHDIILAVANPVEGGKAAPRFRSYMTSLVGRARSMNLTDMYQASIVIRKKLLSGESVWN